MTAPSHRDRPIRTYADGAQVPPITDVPLLADEWDAIEEVYSTVCPACDSGIDETCMVQTPRQGRSVLISWQPTEYPHVARLLATTIIDCRWQDSTIPELRARFADTDGGARLT